MWRRANVADVGGTAALSKHSRRWPRHRACAAGWWRHTGISIVHRAALVRRSSSPVQPHRSVTSGLWIWPSSSTHRSATSIGPGTRPTVVLSRRKKPDPLQRTQPVRLPMGLELRRTSAARWTMMPPWHHHPASHAPVTWPPARVLTQCKRRHRHQRRSLAFRVGATPSVPEAGRASTSRPSSTTNGHAICTPRSGHGWPDDLDTTLGDYGVGPTHPGSIRSSAGSGLVAPSRPCGRGSFGTSRS